MGRLQCRARFAIAMIASLLLLFPLTQGRLTNEQIGEALEVQSCTRHPEVLAWLTWKIRHARLYSN